MLEKPLIQDEKINACLRAEFGLPVDQITFLPLGADRNTAVYRVLTVDGTAYFLKLRSGVFDETSVALPKFLGDQGISEIIVPLAAKSGQLWASLETYKVILYPFIEGQDGYEAALSDRQWVELGRVLKRIHSVELPPSLINRIRRETYSPAFRLALRTILEDIGKQTCADPLSTKLAAFLKEQHVVIQDLVQRAEQLAHSNRNKFSGFVLCHADIHAGNILIDSVGTIHIVDWDDPILAPKERDLMFIGGGLFGGWRLPHEDELLFYRGYGPTRIDPVALAYYRCERIIEDLAVDCELILLTNGNDEDRERSFKFLTSNFLPHGTIALAHQTSEFLKNSEV